MLTCKEFLGWLNEYLCDSQDPECRRHVEEHVTSCPNCWVIFDTTKKTIQVYKGQEPQEVPAAVQHRLMEALQKKIATGAKPPEPKQPN